MKQGAYSLYNSLLCLYVTKYLHFKLQRLLKTIQEDLMILIVNVTHISDATSPSSKVQGRKKI